MEEERPCEGTNGPSEGEVGGGAERVVAGDAVGEVPGGLE